MTSDHFSKSTNWPFFALYRWWNLVQHTYRRGGELGVGWITISTVCITEPLLFEGKTLPLIPGILVRFLQPSLTLAGCPLQAEARHRGCFRFVFVCLFLFLHELCIFSLCGLLLTADSSKIAHLCSSPFGFRSSFAFTQVWLWKAGLEDGKVHLTHRRGTLRSTFLTSVVFRGFSEDSEVRGQSMTED